MDVSTPFKASERLMGPVSAQSYLFKAARFVASVATIPILGMLAAEKSGLQASFLI